MKKKTPEKPEKPETSEAPETPVTPVAKPERMVLKQTQEITTDIPNFLSEAIDKYGAKRLVLAIGVIAFNKGLDKCCFPSNLLATQKDEDNAKDATAIFYLKENWDEFSDKGMKLYTKTYKEKIKQKERIKNEQKS